MEINSNAIFRFKKKLNKLNSASNNGNVMCILEGGMEMMGVYPGTGR